RHGKHYAGCKHTQHPSSGKRCRQSDDHEKRANEEHPGTPAVFVPDPARRPPGGVPLSEPSDFRHKHAQRKAQSELKVTGEVVVVDKRPEGTPAPRFKDPVDLSVGPHVLDKPKDGHGGPEDDKHDIENPGAGAVT